MKLVTIKNKENKKINIDHISGFAIYSSITGLLVTESNETESPDNWPQGGVHSDEWFDEYMNKHCTVSVSHTELGDCLRVYSSDADVFGIRGFVVTISVIVDGGKEHPIYEQLEVVVPHHNFFGSEGIDVVHNVLKGLGVNHLARAQRIKEITASDIAEQKTAVDEPSPFEHVEEIGIEQIKQVQTEAMFSYWKAYLPTRIHSTDFRAALLGNKLTREESKKYLSTTMSSIGFSIASVVGVITGRREESLEKLEFIKNYFEITFSGFETIMITSFAFRSIDTIGGSSIWYEFKENIKGRVFSHAKASKTDVVIKCMVEHSGNQYIDTLTYDHSTDTFSSSVNTISVGAM